MNSRHIYLLQTLPKSRENANLQCKYNDSKKTEETEAVKNEIRGQLSDHHHHKTHHCRNKSIPNAYNFKHELWYQLNEPSK